MIRRVLRWATVIVLLSMVAGAGALAAGDLATLHSLWGTQMTAEQFLQVMNPDFLSALPARSREAAKTTPVQWGGTRVVMTSSRNAMPGLGSAAPGFQEPSMAELFDIYVSYKFSFPGTTASFGTPNAIIEPLFMLMPSWGV